MKAKRIAITSAVVVVAVLAFAYWDSHGSTTTLITDDRTKRYVANLLMGYMESVKAEGAP